MSIILVVLGFIIGLPMIAYFWLFKKKVRYNGVKMDPVNATMLKYRDFYGLTPPRRQTETARAETDAVRTNSNLSESDIIDAEYEIIA